MSFLVALVVEDIDYCPDILDAWEKAGVSGVTILSSTGLGSLRNAALRDDIPIIPSLHDLFENIEVHHRTLLSVVENQALVDKIADIAQEIIGNLEDPHTGFLFVVPIVKVIGMGKHRTVRVNE